MADHYRPGRGYGRRGRGDDDSYGSHRAGYSDNAYSDDGYETYGDDGYGDSGYDDSGYGDQHHRGYGYGAYGYEDWDTDGGAHRRAGGVRAAAGDVVWRYRSAPLWIRVTADICVAVLAIGLIVGVSLALHSESTPERASASGATTTSAPTTTTLAPTTLAPATTLPPTTEASPRTTTASTVPATTVPPTTTAATRPAPPPTRPPTTPTTQPAVRYHNCFDAWRAGALPLHRGDPGYSANLDDDHDGNACEPGEGLRG
jgi:Excalibur calcium-binding domain